MPEERNDLRMSLYSDNALSNPKIAQNLMLVLGSNYFAERGNYILFCQESFGWGAEEVDGNIERCIELINSSRGENRPE
jgi:hypothetical protein